MNRRDRRAARAAGQTPPGHGMPPRYAQGVERMAAALKRARASGAPPVRLYLPDPHILLVGSIDHVADIIARDEPARALLAEIVAQVEPDLGEPPTIFQLCCALQIAGYPWVVCPLSDFGRLLPFQPGGTG